MEDGRTEQQIDANISALLLQIAHQASVFPSQKHTTHSNTCLHTHCLDSLDVWIQVNTQPQRHARRRGKQSQKKKKLCHPPLLDCANEHVGECRRRQQGWMKQGESTRRNHLLTRREFRIVASAWSVFAESLASGSWQRKSASGARRRVQGVAPFPLVAWQGALEAHNSESSKTTTRQSGS